MANAATIASALEPLRREPAHRSELVSEIRGGEWLEILERDGEWARVRNEDDYEGWLADWNLVEQTHEQRAAQLERRLGFVRAPRATLHESDHWAASPLWMGMPLLRPEDDGIAEREQFVRVELPWGASGWVESEWIDRDAPTADAAEALRAAHLLMGTPYRWGGRSPGGLDCSAYVQLAWARAGVRLTRDARLQVDDGEPVALEREAWQAGDLLLFGAPADHVGIYDGRGSMLHARAHVRRDKIERIGPLMERLSAVRRPIPRGAAARTLCFDPAEA